MGWDEWRKIDERELWRKIGESNSGENHDIVANAREGAPNRVEDPVGEKGEDGESHPVRLAKN
jgi:hypothetical protein